MIAKILNNTDIHEGYPTVGFTSLYGHNENIDGSRHSGRMETGTVVLLYVQVYKCSYLFICVEVYSYSGLQVYRLRGVQVFLCTCVFRYSYGCIRGVEQKLSRCTSVVVLLCSLLGSMSWCSGPEHTWTPLDLLLRSSPPAGTEAWRSPDSAHPATPTSLAHQSALNQEVEMVSTWVRARRCVWLRARLG